LRVVVPHQLIDLLAALVVLDELDDRCRGQLGAVMLAAKAQHAQVGEVVPPRELIVVEQLVVGLFLDRGFDTVRGAQSLQQLVALGGIRLDARKMQGGLRIPR
jgi:hypothetical protein